MKLSTSSRVAIMFSLARLAMARSPMAMDSPGSGVDIVGQEIEDWKETVRMDGQNREWIETARKWMGCEIGGGGCGRYAG